MSTLKVNNLQVGQDATATNNFTLYQPSTPNGTVRLGVGNVGSVTDILQLSSNGKVGVGGNPTNYPDIFNVIGGASHCDRYFHNRISSTLSTSDRGILFSVDGVAQSRIYSPNALSLSIQSGVGTLTDTIIITQAGRIGIGTTSPTLNATTELYSSASEVNFQVHYASNSRGGLAALSSQRLAIYTTAAADNIVFGRSTTDATAISGSNFTERMRINNNNGDVTINAGNLVIGTSGKGIDFSATGNSSGSMTSELLSDYEEGTWTPVFQGSTSNPTVTYTQQNGWYTKIGNIVYINLILTTNAASGGSGDLRIGGLPFSADTSGYYQMHRLLISEALSMTTAITSAIITEEITTTQIFTDVTTAALAPGSNNNRIRINGWYRAA